MKYRDLRDFIAQLEKLGELKRVAAEVDPHLEMTEVCDRVLRADGSPVDWGAAAIRFVAGSAVGAALAFGAWAVRGEGPGTVAGAIGLVLGATAIGWMYLDGRRRTWFDLAAGTMVVVAPPKA